MQMDTTTVSNIVQKIVYGALTLCLFGIILTAGTMGLYIMWETGVWP